MSHLVPVTMKTEVCALRFFLVFFFFFFPNHVDISENEGTG